MLGCVLPFPCAVVSVSFTRPLYMVYQSKGPAVVCIVATPSANVPINVTVVAGEDKVPSARSKGGRELAYLHNNLPHHSLHLTQILATFQLGHM